MPTRSNTRTPTRTAAPAALLLLSLLAALTAGCRSFTKVTVHVHDAETGRPVDSALVCVKHQRIDELDFRPTPKVECARTIDGVTEVRADLSVMPRLEVTAHGYLPGSTTLYRSEGPQGKSGKSATVELLHQPAPVVLVTVPSGYRGVVKIGLRHDGTDWTGRDPPRKRHFALTVAPPAVNWFDGSDLLQRAVQGEHVYAQFDDGTPIPVVGWGDGESVAFRRLTYGGLSVKGRRGSGAVHIFLVGTAAEYAPKAKAIQGVSGPEVDEHFAETFGTPEFARPADEGPGD